MTDYNTITNEELPMSVPSKIQGETMQDEIEGRFTDSGEDDLDAGSDDPESSNGELTPNDIFGLDPLDVMTLEELAEYLKVSPAAVRKTMKEQELPGRNIGGEWRFLRDAVANWLRGQELPAQQQQNARVDYSKAKVTPPPQDREGERFSRPPQRQYQSEQSGGGDYRARQRFPEGGQQYGNREGGQQYGNREGGQYENRGGQYGGGQSGGGDYSAGRRATGGNYGANEGGSESYSRPPRRPFRPAEGGGQGNFTSGPENAGSGGYGGGAAGGARFGGGGYSSGGQRFAGGPKRKNKRQVFDNERGKRLDRRKEDGTPEVQE